MPVELRFQAAGKLDYGVASDGVLEWFDNYFRAGGVSCFDGRVHIGDEISGAFLAEWKWNGSLKRKNGKRADGRRDGLELRAAGNGQNIHDHWFGSLAAERSDETFDESI